MLSPEAPRVCFAEARALHSHLQTHRSPGGGWLEACLYGARGLVRRHCAFPRLQAGAGTPGAVPPRQRKRWLTAQGRARFASQRKRKSNIKIAPIFHHPIYGEAEFWSK